jgi:lysophospholipase L1-like esterase
MHEFGSFAALGDSFTEGVGDPSPDGAGCRGWADRFAEQLATHRPGLRYANLAIRGKLLSEVLDEQVPAAVALAPDLVSLAAGGNDLLRPRTDPDALAEVLESAVASLTGAGCRVMVFTGFDPKAFPVIRMIRGKAAVFNTHVKAIANDYDCLIADLWPMRILTDRRLWEPDRLHLGPDGHRRVALLACEVVGVPVTQDWRAPLTAEQTRPGRAAAATSWLTARWNDIEWITDHAAPYLSRRLHGVSSGDGMPPKRPALIPFDADLADVAAGLAASGLAAASAVGQAAVAGSAAAEPASA